MIYVPITLGYLFKDSIKYTNKENRKLASKPTLSFKNIFNYPKEYEEYFNDHLPFRNNILEEWRNINYRLFNISIDSRIIVGKDNNNDTWLFFNNVGDGDELSYIVGSKNYSSNYLSSTLNHLNDEVNKLNDLNVDVYYIIVPNKSSIYANYLPKTIDVKEDAFLTVYNYILRNNFNKLLYPYDSLNKKKDDYELFYRTDTHLNDYGMYILISDILNEIYDNENILKIEKFDTNFTYDFKGDLYKYMGVSIKIKDNNYNIKYKNSDNIKSEIIKNNQFDIYTNNDYTIDETILVVGDSFTNLMIKPLSSVYKKVIRVKFAEYNSDIIKEYNPDKIFYVRTERFSDEISSFSF